MLLSDLDIPNTPTIVYKDHEGKLIYFTSYGMIGETLHDLLTEFTKKAVYYTMHHFNLTFKDIKKIYISTYERDDYEDEPKIRTCEVMTQEQWDAFTDIYDEGIASASNDYERDLLEEIREKLYQLHWGI
jgi:hypothetical protein